MRFPRLNAKLMNRLCVLALLFAPILYLFGVQWTSLLGAHGEIVLADEVVTSEEFDLNVEIGGITYKRWFYVDGESYFSNGYHETAYFYLYPDSCIYSLSDEYDFHCNIPYGTSYDYDCFGFFDGSDFYSEVTLDLGWNPYFSVVWSSEDGYVVSSEMYYNISANVMRYLSFQVAFENGEWVYSFSDTSSGLDIFDVDNKSAYLDFGSEISNPALPNVDELYLLLNQYRKAPLKAPKIVHTEGNPDPTPSDNSKYLFENFFPKDNWVTNMGRDVSAGSNPPYGFAPFGTLINYIDENMLHFHETDNSPGLFFYGYSYWCIHVIILDLAVYAIAFIPRIFFKVMNKLEGMDS